MTAQLKSIHGRQLGLTRAGKLVNDGYHVPRLNYASVAASAAITNTTVATFFDSLATIKANSLVPGSLIKIRFHGIATATNSTDTLAIALLYGTSGGTTLIAIPATDVADNDVFTGEYEIVHRTVGASSAWYGVGTFKSIPAAEGTMTIKDEFRSVTGFDTTVDKEIGVSATWSVASASNSVRLDYMRVEVW